MSHGNIHPSEMLITRKTIYLSSAASPADLSLLRFCWVKSTSAATTAYHTGFHFFPESVTKHTAPLGTACRLSNAVSALLAPSLPGLDRLPCGGGVSGAHGARPCASAAFGPSAREAALVRSWMLQRPNQYQLSFGPELALGLPGAMPPGHMLACPPPPPRPGVLGRCRGQDAPGVDRGGG